MGAIVKITVPNGNVSGNIKRELENILSKVTGEPVTVNIIQTRQPFSK